MTLCIVAECQHEGRPALIMCSDMQGTDFAKSDDTFKLRDIRGVGAAAALAGDIAAATELISTLGPIMRPHYETEPEPGDFDLWANALLTTLRQTARDRRADNKRDFVQRTYGLTLPEFYASASTFGPEAIAEVRKIGLGCELLITDVVHEPIIFWMTDDGEVRWEERYACIGSGSTIARAILCQENWDTSMTLMDCAVRVMSAKRAAQKDPYVGVGTNLVALLPYEGLRRNFSRLGQKFIADNRLKIEFPAKGITVPG